ncbi:HutD family protein [Comamonas resistens]|uniref:HutD family protein n=1 Tax=Comamonas resistens TaxID=3046670 RepID=A0ABY8SSN1_9BURK|nr:HutD family protein [Comamonas resistens]MDL5037051.1 HutD family protein [Comamonas resistens]WHS65745.1 HutD family protein [Comamonas resistens]
MQRFDLNQIAPSPWKNGGGSTREIVCFPPGAGMDSFAWRISVAMISQAGPFSAFPGIDRQIMLLDGDGVQLVSAAAGIDHALQQRWQPFAFSGDVALDCSLLGGTSTDFNVMTRRGQWSAEVSIHDAAVRPGRSAAGLCLVLQGGFVQGRTLLQAGQGLWWDAAEDAEPLLPHDAHSRLVLVSLHQAA